MTRGRVRMGLPYWLDSTGWSAGNRAEQDDGSGNRLAAFKGGSGLYVRIERVFLR